MNRREFSFGAGALALSNALSPFAHAQAKWPEKPITLIVPFTPGGGTDFLSRLIADRISKETKVDLVSLKAEHAKWSETGIKMD